MANSNINAISCHPFGTDLIQIIAKEIEKNHQQQFPFLQNIIILLPNYYRAADLQQQILIEFGADDDKNNSTAMASPQIFAFKDYIDKTTVLDKQTIPKNARELILIKALQEHKDLFGKHNLLTTAYALLELFDELTRKQISLPENLNDFIQQLEKAYNCKNEQQESLSNEAQIVHTLWLAWHKQLSEINSVDSESQYQLKLAKNLNQTNNNFYYIAGFFDFLPAEIQWINAHITNNRLKLFFQTETNEKKNDYIKTLLSKFNSPIDYYDTNLNNSLFFQAVFNHQNSYFQTRTQLARKNLSPLNNTLQTFQARSFEEEALAISIQIRSWLNQKKTNIALILEDRRLARRVRALLQRNGIGMGDSSGWAISTTTAASVIESWLQCTEENFHFSPLLDILKSPFAFEQTNEHTQAVFRFEQDIIFRENISRDLNRYEQAWTSRQQRLDNNNDCTSIVLTGIFKQLSKAAQPLLDIQNKPSAFLSEHLSALNISLSKLNTYQLLDQDDAGETIIALLENLEKSADHTDIQLDWTNFRHWLSLKLEENNFSPSNHFEHSVELLHLSQTSLGSYDGIIIGGMTKDQFPGSTKQTPFFNQSVRQELGLNESSKVRHIKFHYFRTLLEASPSILLSYHTGAQESLPSPWLELLIRFHELAFSTDLENQSLHEMISQQNENKTASQKNKYIQSLPQLNHNLTPGSLSASAHQTLIQCPYAFFSGQTLRLHATDEISEKLAKSDYGERIHLCLHAFHEGGITDIDGPFREKISESNKTKAINFLITISEQVFAYDLEDNFQHRGWLKRWVKLIPAYINWQMQHEQDWQFQSGEIKTSASLDSNLKLHGRIDRIDQSSDNISIIDYKTGAVPNIQDVENGEAIQLIHYAIANPKKVSRVEYLQFESGTKDIAEKCTLENEALDELSSKTQERLLKIINAIREGEKLPAWGHEDTCKHCQFAGLCRHKLI